MQSRRASDGRDLCPWCDEHNTSPRPNPPRYPVPIYAGYDGSHAECTIPTTFGVFDTTVGVLDTTVGVLDVTSIRSKRDGH